MSDHETATDRRGSRGATAAVTPARAVAYAVLRRVFEQEAWADRALHGEAARAGLETRERAFATQLVYGAVQRVRTLDHVAGALARRPAEQLDPPVRAALRLGLQQILFLDRVPAHAAVGASVELVKADAPRAAGLVNAVLRRAAERGETLLEGLDDGTPEGAALARSYPDWVARAWTASYGAQTARELMDAGNRPAEATLRANTLRTTPEALAAELPVAARPAPGPPLPEALVLDAPFDAFRSPLWEAGAFMPQSRAAMAVSRVLAPAAGDRVLDLCAAPGGKTTHLAALLGGDGEVVAVEVHPGRADALRRTAERMGAGTVRVACADAAAWDEPDAYDRVLVDPPCSDLGTLAARPDARWRKTGRQVERLRALQGQILRAGARAVRPGGVLVYSTCTISPAENERQIAAFLAEAPGFALEDPGDDWRLWQHPGVPLALQTLPHRDRTDGFFIARLRRTA
jgi:16S rRNA (cytosine967-C5)-methyltransferase